MPHEKEHIQKLLEDRYYLRDEEGNLLEHSPEEMFARVSVAIAVAEKDEQNPYGYLKQEEWQKKFFDLMVQNKFLPNTPTLINAGKNNPGSFSACFVLPVNDSMEGIFDAVKKAALISKAGGGVGFNFGNLREKGSLVKSTGHRSSGPISFMRVFDTMCDTISQGGVRRGAMIAVLPVWHPDIEEFISCKDDGVTFSNFNISVGITDEFMEAVESDNDFALKSPVDGLVKYISAKHLWNQIVEHAHKTGDPGLFFLDTVNKAHPLEEKIEAPNPCLHGSTLLVDKTGLKRIDEGDGEFYRAWKTGEKETVKVTLSSGQEIICTPDHLLMTATGFVEAKDTLNMFIVTDTPFNFIGGEETLDEKYVLAGFLFGDGYKCGNGEGYSVKLSPEKEPDVALMLEQAGFNRQNSGAYYKKLSGVFGNEWYGTSCEYKTLPKEILADYTKLRAFLKGLFEANGSVHSGRITYKTTSKKLAQEIQVALNVLNIKSYTTINKAKNTKFTNGTYECKQSYDLNIGDIYSIANFRFFIGFISKNKTSKIDSIDRNVGSRKYPKVVSVLPYQVTDVYDFSMYSDVTKWNNANGIGVHNCGELPLRKYESCNLGSINLMAYLKQEFAPNNDGLTDSWYEFDWDKLEEDIPTMVRFLDDVIEVNPYPLPEIEKATKESRKIGLGIMGWADCLIKMKIPYDSDIAIDLAEELMEFIYEESLQASRDLAIEKGSYPLSQHETIEQRNATLLTVAPTGTLSRIAGVSSGIEPIFAWETHHNLEGHEYDETHWALEEIHKQEAQYNSDNVRIPRPKWMKTASEIAPAWHLRMQTAFQKHVDNSISKTINLPSTATVDDVHEIYRRAWEMGLKGITIYRDGSKENQPLNNIELLKGDYLDLDFLQDVHMLEKQNKKVLEAIAKVPPLMMNDFVPTKTTSSLKKRGPVAVGVTHKVDTGKGKIYVTVNYSEYHAEPVEVFIRLGHLATPSESALAEWSGRLLSLMLKYNLPINDIVKQGNKVYSDMVFWYNKKSFCSFPKLISHLLSYTFEEAMEMAEMDLDSMKEFPVIDSTDEDRYDIITAGDSQTREYCYNCGTYGMIKEGGCSVCENCGFENCG